MEDTLLCGSVTVKKYRQLEETKNKNEIADCILKRFKERYIAPLLGNSKTKHGFCTMAISCLMIEALESFLQGWSDTKNKSKCAFTSFFARCSKNGSELSIFSDHANDFYTNVRCGILHQAETTGGWRILRKGPLFDLDKKIINATKFHSELSKYLQSYYDELKKSNWDDKVWQNLIKKMNAVIQNCKP